MSSVNEDKGLLNKYYLEKRDGSPIDPRSEYFILRLDDYANDKFHLKACRLGLLMYALQIRFHLPVLFDDLMYRWGYDALAEKLLEIKREDIDETDNSIITKKYILRISLELKALFNKFRIPCLYDITKLYQIPLGTAEFTYDIEKSNIYDNLVKLFDLYIKELSEFNINSLYE